MIKKIIALQVVASIGVPFMTSQTCVERTARSMSIYIPLSHYARSAFIWYRTIMALACLISVGYALYNDLS